jgi:ABC-2 type transport system permease protein
VLSCRGFALTAIIRTARSANMASMIIFFMFMFLGAIFFPTEVMPDSLRAVSNALPSTNLNDAFRGIMIMGAGISDVWHDLLIVGGWFIGSLVIAVRLFRWE